jgi:hypothetical protein
MMIYTYAVMSTPDVLSLPVNLAACLPNSEHPPEPISDSASEEK